MPISVRHFKFTSLYLIIYYIRVWHVEVRLYLTVYISLALSSGLFAVLVLNWLAQLITPGKVYLIPLVCIWVCVHVFFCSIHVLACQAGIFIYANYIYFLSGYIQGLVFNMVYLYFQYSFLNFIWSRQWSCTSYLSCHTTSTAYNILILAAV